MFKIKTKNEVTTHDTKIECILMNRRYIALSHYLKLVGRRGLEPRTN